MVIEGVLLKPKLRESKTAHLITGHVGLDEKRVVDPSNLRY
jgi:hypothetical protein